MSNYPPPSYNPQLSYNPQTTNNPQTSYNPQLSYNPQTTNNPQTSYNPQLSYNPNPYPPANTQSNYPGANTNYLANPNLYLTQSQPSYLPHSPISQQPLYQPNGAPNLYPMTITSPAGAMMPMNPGPISHKLEHGFRSKYIKCLTNSNVNGNSNLQQRYPLYESRIKDINEICNQHGHVLRSWLSVLGILGIAAGGIIFATRECVLDPNGTEQQCTGSGYYRKCNYYNCKLPIIVPIAPIVLGILLFLIVSVYANAVVGRLLADLQSKLAEINQADVSHGVTWFLRSEVHHHTTHNSSSYHGSSTSTTITKTHFIDLYLK